MSQRLFGRVAKWTYGLVLLLGASVALPFSTAAADPVSRGAPQSGVVIVSDTSWAVDGRSAAMLVQENCIPETWAHPSLYPAAKWIWSSACAASDTESHKFSRRFTVADTSAAFELSVAADNYATVSVNGQNAGRVDGFMSLATIDISKFVRRGDNFLEIDVHNQPIGAAPGWGNPAGLLAWLVSSKTQRPLGTWNASGSIAGLWQSDWGPVTLRSDAIGNITGSWDQGKGSLGVIKSGHFDFRTGHLEFSFYQPWNNENGFASFQLSNDGLRLAGTWKHSSGSGSWTMTRTRGSSGPPFGTAPSTASVGAPSAFQPCFVNAGSIAALAPCKGKPGTRIYIRLSRTLRAPLVYIVFKPFQVTGIPGATGAAVTAPVAGNGVTANSYYEIDAPAQLCLGGGGSWDLFPLDATGQTQGDIGRFTVDCR